MTANKIIQAVIDGCLPEMIRQKTLTASSSMRPTLAQKQGHRKAGRTRARRMYTEHAGYLYHYYYNGRPNP